MTQTKTYQPPFTDGNTIRCSDAASNNMQCKYRIASNGTSQARIRPISSALSISDQAPKKKAWAIRATFLSSPSLSAFRRYHLALSPTPQRRTAKLPLFHPSSLYIPNHRPKMAQRVTLRKRQPYNTTSNRRRVVKTPGGKLVVHHLKKIAVSLLPVQNFDNARRMDRAKR